MVNASRSGWAIAVPVRSVALVATISRYCWSGTSGSRGTIVTFSPDQRRPTSMRGITSRASCTEVVSIRVEKLTLIVASSATSTAPPRGSVATTLGLPTVLKVKGPLAPIRLPARSRTPAASATEKLVSSGRWAAGVKIMAVPRQLNAPTTLGEIANATCAVAWSTGSEKTSSRLAVVRATEPSPGRCCVTAKRSTWGGRTSTVLA